MLQDFEPFIRGYENECGEPLPFGREARDDVAQLAGWIEVMVHCKKIFQ